MKTLTNVLTNTKKAVLFILPGLSIVANTCFGTVAIAPDGVSTASSSFYDLVPPSISPVTPPLIMLAMSNDHQMYYKAYPDYSDLDDDDVLDVTYKDSFEYDGYFASNVCYQYSATNKRFEPSAKTAIVTDASGNPVSSHRCTVGAQEWSGNFLNWASMSRMDIIRKVLYGGTRVTDTATETVLERAFIPQDSHAFAKVYDGADIGFFTPWKSSDLSGGALSICNTTFYDNQTGTNSQNVTKPPLLRLAEGSWPRWATAEVVQCAYRSERNHNQGARPNTTPINLVARVKVCVAGFDADSDDCKAYGSGASTSYKPVGVMQQFGDSGEFQFGLVTGSYEKSTKGGVLRKNIYPLVDNEAANVSQNEIDLADGSVISGGIITKMDALRVVNRRQSSYSDCPNGSTTSTIKSDSKCKNWGNPIAEIYLEALRYISGKGSASTAFNANDSSLLSSLAPVAWVDPYATTPVCSQCSIILISSGLNSFDGDDFNQAGDIVGLTNGLTGLNSVSGKTDIIGTKELFSGDYFIGSNGSNTITCSSKSFSTLSKMKGLCPAEPEFQGSFNVAGLAHHAFITDLRDDGSTNSKGELLEGKQNVKTYAVELSETLPNLTFNVGTNVVSFSPNCRRSGGNKPVCSLVDVVVEEYSNGGDYGSFLFAWEDATAGSDNDLDAVERIEYCVGISGCGPTGAGKTYAATGTTFDGVATDTQVQIRVTIPLAQTGATVELGYFLTGASTTDPKYNDPYNVLKCNSFCSANTLTGGSKDYVSDPITFDVSGVLSTASFLKTPLYYAAKYGNFNDSDGDNFPNLQEEWDVRNLDGDPLPDGFPDNYFLVKNPTKLSNSLEQVLGDIDNNVTSSSSAAVVANTAGGTGAIYQAIYEPGVEDDAKRSVDWIGSVISFFIDEDSRFREDYCDSSDPSSCNKKLDANDAVINFYFKNGKPVFDRINPVDGTTVLNTAAPIDFRDLNVIWDAAKQLSAIPDAKIVTQRVYNSSAGQGRFIKTWIDGLNNGSADGKVDSLEFVDFDVTTFGDKLPTTATTGSYNASRFLGFDSNSDVVSGDDFAKGLVNFIRGKDQSFAGWRSRQLDRDNTGVVTERLGDIIHSAPEVVGRPADGFDARYSDKSYAEYKSRWENRRQVIYTGGNDGMLHAFNAGFFTPENYEFTTHLTSEAKHPLGSELWAYIPQSLLPHLQWLKEPDYSHVYYVDGNVESFDVNIFSPSDKYKNGWGTILVATMRLGGGDITIDPNSDPDADPSDDITLSSSVMVFDVTDPESAPVLLAELSQPGLGFTTSKPVVVKKRPKDSGGSYDNTNDKWFLIFGSGPAGSDGSTKQDALEKAVSNQQAQLYAVDISTSSDIKWVDFNSADSVIDPYVLTSETDSFVGDLAVADWNNDFQDDVVYFGTAGKASGVDTGHLFRFLLPSTFAIANSTDNKLLIDTGASDANQPFTAAPLPLLDPSGSAWVFAGAGRFLSSDDLLTSQQLSFHGVQEPRHATTNELTYDPVDKDKLVDTTDIFVYQNGEVGPRPVSAAPTQSVTLTSPDGTTYGTPDDLNDKTVQTYSELRAEVPKTPGWFMDLGAESADPVKRQRNLLSPVRFSSLVLFDEYTPSGESCDVDGSSRLVGLSVYTGTASPEIILELDTSVNLVPGNARVLTGIDMKEGQLVGISVHNKNIITQKGIQSGSTSPTIVDVPYGRRSWREVPIQ